MAILVLLCPFAKAQELPQSHRIRAQIDIRNDSEKNLSASMIERNGLQSVPTSSYIVVPRMEVEFVRISDTEIQVRLSSSYQFRFLENGEFKKFEFSEFVLKGSKSVISQLMNLEAGSLVTHSESNFKEARRFVEVMKSPGFTTEMLEFVEGRFGPLALYQISDLSFNINARTLIRGEAIPITHASYRVDTRIPIVLGPTSRDEKGLLSLERSGVVVDPADPLLEEYRQARATLVERLQSLKHRGWWPQRDTSGELRRQSTELGQIDFIDTETLEPLRFFCSKIFAE